MRNASAIPARKRHRPPREKKSPVYAAEVTVVIDAEPLPAGLLDAAVAELLLGLDDEVDGGRAKEKVEENEPK